MPSASITSAALFPCSPGKPNQEVLRLFLTFFVYVGVRDAQNRFPARTAGAASDTASSSRNLREAEREKCHIPTDLVVAQEASDVGSSSRLDFLLLHNLRRRFIA